MENTLERPPALGRGKIVQDDDDGDENACVKWCFAELDPDNMTLEYDKPPDFVTSRWMESPTIYIVYRALAAVVLPVWVLGDMWYESANFYRGETWRWFIFASNWSLALLALSAVAQLITSSIYEYQPYWIMDPIYIRTVPGTLKVQWILVNISYNSAVVVTSAYWFFMAIVSGTTLLTTWMSRIKHTLNTVYVILDIMISATPIRVYHMFFAIFLGSIYIVFNAVYFSSDGTLLPVSAEGFGGRPYYFMNWSAPVETVCTCVFGVSLCAAAQMILHGLYHLRIFMQGKADRTRLGSNSELQNIKTTSDNYSSLQ